MSIAATLFDQAEALEAEEARRARLRQWRLLMAEADALLDEAERRNHDRAPMTADLCAPIARLAERFGTSLAGRVCFTTQEAVDGLLDVQEHIMRRSRLLTGEQIPPEEMEEEAG